MAGLKLLKAREPAMSLFEHGLLSQAYVMLSILVLIILVGISKINPPRAQ